MKSWLPRRKVVRLYIILLKASRVKMRIYKFPSATQSEGALEEHSVEFFLKKINEKTTKAIASKRDEISKAYQEWKKNTACRKFQSFNLRFREPPQLQYRELPKEEYNCLFDPHYYYTSNFLLPCTFGVVALASPAVALLVAVKAGA